MARGTNILFCLGACIALMACPSGPSSDPSSSGKDEAAIVARKIEHIEGLLARRSEAGGVLDDLMSALPDRVWLTEVVYDSGKVRIKGNALSNNLVADYISRLGERPSLANISLGGSVMKTARGREWVEFALGAAVQAAGSPSAPAGTSPAARLEELEKELPSRQDSADMLRELQRLALDAGLQMTKFTPGPEVPGEFTSAWPVTIEVSGDRDAVGRYLEGLAGLPRLWVVDRFSFKAASMDDPRAKVRASVMARTYFAP